MRGLPAPPTAGIALAIVCLVGCAKAEKWVSEKADESLAHEIESATDEIADGKYHPSGVPIRKKKTKKPGAETSASAGVTAEIAEPSPPESSAAPPRASAGH